MSLSPAAEAARTLIARSDRLFLDTVSLRYVAGLARPEEVSAAAVKELIDAGELQVVAGQSNGVVVMELTDDAFRRGLAGRRRSKSQAHRVDALSIKAGIVSGPRTDAYLLDGSHSRTLIVIPFTSSLFGRLLTATGEALEAFREDPRRVGETTRTPGHLVPAKDPVRGEKLFELVSFFEGADLNVLINAANGQYVFGTVVHDLWIGTHSLPISEFVEDVMSQLGKRASATVRKLAEMLLRDPLVSHRTIHQDEESHKVMDAVSSFDSQEGA